MWTAADDDIIGDCPRTEFDGGLEALHEADSDHHHHIYFPIITQQKSRCHPLASDHSDESSREMK